MRIITSKLRGLAVLVSLALALTSCSLGVQDLPKLTNQDNILAMNCDEVTGTIAQLDAVKTASDDDKAKFESQTGVKPSDEKALASVRTQLVTQQTAVCDAGTADIVIDEATIKALTITTGTYKCKVDGNGLIVFDDLDKTKWYAADSYGPKLSKSPSRKEIQKRICGPVEGAVFLRWLTDLKFANWNMQDGNPWLKQLAEKFNGMSINEVTAYYMPLVDVQGTPDDEAVRVAVVRNREWQQVASKLATLLERPQVEGVLSLLSSKNYHAGYWEIGLPSVTLNGDYEENKPAFVFVLKNKMGKCLVRFGFNVKDGRLEQFSCVSKAVVKKVVVKKVVKAVVTPPGKGGKCKPPSKPSGGKCIVKKTVVRGTTPKGGGGKSEDGAAKSPTPPKVDEGSGATVPPPAPTTPREPAPAPVPAPEPGSGDNDGTVAPPP